MSDATGVLFKPILALFSDLKKLVFDRARLL